MRLWLLLPLLSFSTLIRSEDCSDVTVIIRGSKTIAATSDEFVCATIYWWPPEKCNYGQCPWGKASILNLDLTNPLLAKAIQAFCPLRIRVGGSLQDQVVYGTPNLGSPCNPFTKVSSGLFGFSQGCITMERWDAINDLFLNTGAVMTFGLNALQGRREIRKGVWGGAWNSSNAKEFMEYTVSMSYPIDSWEFGNDPRVANRILDPQYLSRVSDTFRDLQLTIQRHGPWSAPWVGEAGGAYNSGSRLVSNTFLNSFWYLDQLGQSAKYDTKVYCRQTLIGGNYGLLDTETFVPNPDYYSALLWHRLMGKGVLSVDISGSSYLRAYAAMRTVESKRAALLSSCST